MWPLTNMLPEDSKNACFKIVEEKLSELQAIKVAQNAIFCIHFLHFLTFEGKTFVIFFTIMLTHFINMLGPYNKMSYCKDYL